MIKLKTPQEIEIMAEAGAKLATVKNALAAAVKVGVSAADIEVLAQKMIKEVGAIPAFDKVKDYKWATCVVVNEGLVHGIPHPEIVFKKGDLVSVDVGLIYKGFNSDTSISVGIDLSPQNQRFFNVGKNALEKALSKAKAGNHIYDISLAIEDTIEDAGYSTIKALVGHGIGRDLHEEPQIPCFLPDKIENSPLIVPGMVLAVEVMYAMGSDKVDVLNDGWTIGMRDGKIAGLFEETIAITEKGSRVLTR